MSDKILKEIQATTRKLQITFLDYANKKLNGKKAPKPPNMQADYDKLIDLLHKYFGVEKVNESPAERSKRITDGALAHLKRIGQLENH